MKGRQINYNADELAWVEARMEWPRVHLHMTFCFIFDRADVSLTNLNALCKRKGWLTGRTGGFEKGVRRADNPARKGYAPAGCEKGWFKKGTVAPNTLPLWSERMSKDGYIEMKVPERNPWTGHATRFRHKHRYLWEQANGAIPNGYALKCLDGNKLNTDPSNWTCIPRGVLPRLTRKRGFDQAPAEVKPTIMAIARLEHTAAQLRKDSE